MKSEKCKHCQSVHASSNLYYGFFFKSFQKLDRVFTFYAVEGHLIPSKSSLDPDIAVLLEILLQCMFTNIFGICGRIDNGGFLPCGDKAFNTSICNGKVIRKSRLLVCFTLLLEADLLVSNLSVNHR